MSIKTVLLTESSTRSCSPPPSPPETRMTFWNRTEACCERWLRAPPGNAATVVHESSSMSYFSDPAQTFPFYKFQIAKSSRQPLIGRPKCITYLKKQTLPPHGHPRRIDPRRFPGLGPKEFQRLPRRRRRTFRRRSSRSGSAPSSSAPSSSICCCAGRTFTK